MTEFACAIDQTWPLNMHKKKLWYLGSWCVAFFPWNNRAVWSIKDVFTVSSCFFVIYTFPLFWSCFQVEHTTASKYTMCILGCTSTSHTIRRYPELTNLCLTVIRRRQWGAIVIKMCFKQQKSAILILGIIPLDPDTFERFRMASTLFMDFNDCFWSSGIGGLTRLTWLVAW